MIPGQKKERVFDDPGIGGLHIKPDLSPMDYLRLKFHFFCPLFTAAISTIFLVEFANIDTSAFSRSDLLVFLLILIVTCQSLLLSLRLTDWQALENIFERRER